MAFFRKKPVVVEAITFDEFVQYGKQAEEANIVNGMPWSFKYKGHAVSHENDECYLIPTLEGIHNFTPDDVLITGVKGEIYPCKIDIFKQTYDSSSEPTEFGEFIDALTVFASHVGKRMQSMGGNAMIPVNRSDIKTIQNLIKKGTEKMDGISYGDFSNADSNFDKDAFVSIVAGGMTFTFFDQESFKMEHVK